MTTGTKKLTSKISSEKRGLRHSLTIGLLMLGVFFSLTNTALATKYDRPFKSPGTSTITVPVGDHQVRVTGFNLPRVTNYTVEWWYKTNNSGWKNIKTSNLGVLLAYAVLDLNWNGSRFWLEGDYYENVSYIQIDAEVDWSSGHETHSWKITGKQLTTTVTLDRQGGSGGSGSVTAIYGSPMPSASAPAKTGYNFQGYFDQKYGQGTRYYNANMSSAKNWDKVTSSATIYADWGTKTYAVTLDRKGGTGGSTSVTVTYDNPMPSITIPSRNGYTFLGYFASTSPSATRYYNANGTPARLWNNDYGATIYAQWEPKTYNVALDRQGGSGGSSSVTATFDSAMPSATVPSPPNGYTFQGYFDKINGQGNRYYSASMSSARNWDKASGATLYAYWVANTYTVTLDRQGGSGGSSSVTATYGSAMPSATKPSKSGCTFAGYFTETHGRGTRYYDNNMSSVRNWDIAEEMILYAHWVADYGNRNSQEYGDAVYCRLDFFKYLGFDYDYNHAGLYRGINRSGEHRVFECSGRGKGVDTTKDNSLAGSFTDIDKPYYGSFTVSDTLTAAQRRNIVGTGKELVDAFIEYPTEVYWLGIGIPPAIAYTGSLPINNVSQITHLRCDALVEYTYEYNNVRVWRHKDCIEWSICRDPSSHNNCPDGNRDPDFELSPWAQRGAPPGTGPTTWYGDFSGPWPDTRMTVPSVVSGPQVVAYEEAGYPGKVIMEGTDVSGVYYIRIAGTTYQNPNESPKSETWSVSHTLTQSGTYTYELSDYAGNKTSGSFNLQISSPSAPSGVSASDGTYTDRVRVSWDSPSGATGFEVWRSTSNNSGSASRIGTPNSSPYSDTTAVPGALYNYWVKATNDGGTSPFSSYDSGYRQLSPPTGVSASDGTYTDKIRVEWNNPSGATGYEVWRHTSNNSAAASKIGDPTSSPYDDATATAGQTYYYWVKAKSAITTSGFSSSDSGYLQEPSQGTLQFSSSTYSVAEDGGTVTITVTRTGGSYGKASVNYATANGTATAGSDYTARSGTLNWGDGDAGNKTLTVPIIDDAIVEGNETFTANLSGASGASLGSPSSATVTIIDNDTHNTVTLTFKNYDGSTLATKSVTSGTTFGNVPEPTPTRTDYAWDGKWYKSDGETWTSGDTITANVDALAKHPSNPNTGWTYVDTTRPKVTITSPTTAATYTSSSSYINIRGTASDNEAVARVTVRNHRDISEGYVATGTTTWNYDGITLYQGDNRITVTATDSSGNSATDTLLVKFSGNPFYDGELRSGAVVQEIQFPDNLTPGETVTVRWTLLSYLPIRSSLDTGLWDADAGSWAWGPVTRNGTFSGMSDSTWNITMPTHGKKFAMSYTFECDWVVPNRPGDFQIWFNVAQMDGMQYMIATIPEGVDTRPDPTSAKLILRTIMPGGSDTEPGDEARIVDAVQQFDTLVDIKKRSGATLLSLSLPDNLVAGTTATCEWKLLSYMDIDAEFSIVDVPAEKLIAMEIIGSRIANVATSYNFTYGGEVHRAREYTFRATFTVPDSPGEYQFYFRHRLRGRNDSTWMSCNIAPGVDSRPYFHNGMYGRFVVRSITP